QDLLQQLPVSPQKVHTIPLAASPVFSRSQDPDVVSGTLKSLNLPSGFILFVGTLEPRKNIPTLLHAYRNLTHERNIDTPLLLVGRRGWLYEEIFESIDRLGLNERVRHLAGISDEELAHLYHAAGLLALPSYYEGFGLPPLEAMHCDCPVVVSDRASLPEIVGQDGLMLDADDIDGWAATMERVLSDSEFRAKLVASGRRQARRFSWRKTAEATLELYESS
ncbi:MAG: glycosyltransferase family 4 protein, partial [Chloroflexota bacterium]